MTLRPRHLLFLALSGVLGTARSSLICNRYKTDRVYFAAGDTSVGFTPFLTKPRLFIVYRFTGKPLGTGRSACRISGKIAS